MRRLTAGLAVTAVLCLVLAVVVVRRDDAGATLNIPSTAEDCRGTVWVGNYSERSIATIDQGSNLITHTEPSAGFPVSISFSADGRLAAIHSWNVNSTSIVLGSTGATITTIPLGPATDTTDVQLAPDGLTLYVVRSDGATSTIERRSVAGGSLVAGPTTLSLSSPWGLRVSNDGSHVLVNGSLAGYQMDLIDAATLTVIDTIVAPNSGTIYPDGSAFTPDGTAIWWIDASTRILSRYDIATQVSTPIFSATAVSATGLSLSPDGSEMLLFQNYGATDLGLFDVATQQITSTITLPPAYFQLRNGGFNAEGTRIYLGNFDYANSVMLVIDRATLGVQAVMTGGETLLVEPCPVANDPLPTTTTTATTAPEPVVPKVTG